MAYVMKNLMQSQQNSSTRADDTPCVFDININTLQILTVLLSSQNSMYNFQNRLNSQLLFFVPQRPDVGELEPGVLGAGVVPVLLLAVDALARLGSVQVDENPK